MTRVGIHKQFGARKKTGSELIFLQVDFKIRFVLFIQMQRQDVEKKPKEHVAEAGDRNRKAAEGEAMELDGRKVRKWDWGMRRGEGP